MDQKTMLSAFRKLDICLPSFTRVIVGGGAALVAAYHAPLSTKDIDGVPDKSSLEFSAFKKLVRRVGKELDIAPDWLNDYFSTFLYVLPQDYGNRLVPLYAGKKLEVAALGIEDLILTKCFAGREKDVGHLRFLLKKKPDLALVEKRLDELREKNISGVQKAADFLHDLMDEMGMA